MIRILFAISFFIATAIFSLVSGQETENNELKISGKVLDESGFPVAFGVVNLMNVEDNSLVKTETTDENGLYIFEGIPKGKYFLEVTDMLQSAQSGEAFLAENNMEMTPFVYQAQVQQLTEAVVVKTKPYIERKDGIMTLNVENSISAAGSSAFEILEKAPGHLFPHLNEVMGPFLICFSFSIIESWISSLASW